LKARTVNVTGNNQVKDITQNMGETLIERAGRPTFVFTIAARNYLSQVSVLFDSVRKQCGEIKFCCFVVDGYDADTEIPEVLRNNVFDCRKLGIPGFEEMAFKYYVVEFATALKPYIFNYIFELEEFDSAIYFDPDIKLYSNIKWIEEELRYKSILVTPHLLDYQAYRKNYTGRKPVVDLMLYLYAGTYNLGFAAIKNDSYGQNFTDLWAEILRDQCIHDSTRALCVDQKWADFLSSFFGERLGVIKDAGANVAYWNLHERNLSRGTELDYVVNGSKLKFVHFSGIDINDKDGISAGARWKNISLIDYPEYSELFAAYKDELTKAGFQERRASMPYRYNYFENGLPINMLHRRIYAKLISEGEALNPFSVSGKLYFILNSKNILDQKLHSDSYGSRFILRLLNKLLESKFVFRLLYRLLGSKNYLAFLQTLRGITNLDANIFLIR
jgi:hypothetical protein